MSDFESKIKEANELIKEIFNPNGSQTQLKHIIEVFINLIKIATHNVGHITIVFPKNSLNVFILVSQNKPMRFNKTSKETEIFSNLSCFQKNFQ